MGGISCLEPATQTGKHIFIAFQRVGTPHERLLSETVGYPGAASMEARLTSRIVIFIPLFRSNPQVRNQAKLRRRGRFETCPWSLEAGRFETCPYRPNQSWPTRGLSKAPFLQFRDFLYTDSERMFLVSTQGASRSLFWGRDKCTSLALVILLRIQATPLRGMTVCMRCSPPSVARDRRVSFS